MTKTSIEWATDVWNPVTGCTKVSQGCKHCYAETIANRFWATQYPPNEDGSPRKFTDVRLHPERLGEPLRWKKPRRVFVNSMSDLFHEDVPFFFIAKIFATMALSEEHTFMVLTKRPHRMEEFITLKQNWTMIQNFCETWADNPPEYDKYLPNVWLGVSVEDQKTADKRIPMLLQTPAAARFVSYEPALGPVDFGAFMSPPGSSWSREVALARDDTSELDWVIMGGESGPGARPMHPDWARSVRDQCQAAGVKFFFKQWGEWLPFCPQYQEETEERSIDDLDFNSHYVCFGNRGTVFSEEDARGQIYWCGYQPTPGENPWFLERVGKRAAGRLLDGREWNEFPEATK